MPELMDHVAYLSQEIGPRPAGTEEEQQAALYITEQLQKDAGLSAVIEDFNSASNAELPRAICCVITFVITLASLFLPVLAIPAIVLTLITALLLLLEAFGKPVISKLFARGVSQNVVAKYEPGYSSDGSGSRRRKVVLVSRYDSGKVKPELKSPLLGALRFTQWGTLGAMVCLPILLIVKSLFFLHADGITAIVFNVLAGIGLVLVAIPLIFAVVHKFSSYNEAANANAAGIAVLLDVAGRIGRGRVSAAELDARAEAVGAVMHGREEAIASGFVPEGAQLAYETSAPRPPEPAPKTPEARLASAKAAIAALTGKPVPQSEPAQDISAHLVQVKDTPLGEPTDEDIKELRDETREALTVGHAYDQVREGSPHGDGANLDAGSGVGGVAAVGDGSDGGAVAAGAAVTPDGIVFLAPEPENSTVPDWFTKAQENAKKPKDAKLSKGMRSRYADAFDAALPEPPAQVAQEQHTVDEATEQRLRMMREGFLDTRAPHQGKNFGQEQDGSFDPGQTQGFAPTQDQFSALGQPQGQPTDQPFAGGAAFQGMPGEPNSTTAMQPIDVSDLKFELDGQSGNQAPGDIEQATKPAITLPDIGLSATNLPPIFDSVKQRAPLADAEDAGKTPTKSLLTMLPSIGAEEVAAEKEGKNPAEVHRATDRKPNLAALPSLSGEISPVDLRTEADENLQQTGSVSKAGSFASGATGTFAPVGDELLENVAPDDIYIDDADDSEYATGVTETGAFAGPGYVDMPKSRARRFFDRFGRKKDAGEPSAREWLDVDEDFEAQSVGAARGGWESFRGEKDNYDGTSSYDQDTLYQEDQTLSGFEDDDFNSGKRPWQGGAFSRRRLDSKGEDLDDGGADNFDNSSYSAQQPSQQPQYEADSISGELQQIYQFRHPDIDVEVWFVALGSELAGNAGMKAFLAEHGNDLRGSVIINLEALGNGDLSFIEKEGMYRKVTSSSRMKRYMKKAGQATGIDPQSAVINWADSAATIALRHGYQAMSVVGMDGAKPALYAQGDDVLENINPDILHDNADFVMELLKNI